MKRHGVDSISGVLNAGPSLSGMFKAQAHLLDSNLVTKIGLKLEHIQAHQQGNVSCLGAALDHPAVDDVDAIRLGSDHQKFECIEHSKAGRCIFDEFESGINSRIWQDTGNKGFTDLRLILENRPPHQQRTIYRLPAPDHSTAQNLNALGLRYTPKSLALSRNWQDKARYSVGSLLNRSIGTWPFAHSISDYFALIRLAGPIRYHRRAA